MRKVIIDDQVMYIESEPKTPRLAPLEKEIKRLLWLGVFIIGVIIISQI